MPVEESKPTETPVDPADGQSKGKQVAVETVSDGEEEEEEEEGVDERPAMSTGEKSVAEPSLLASTSSKKKKSKKKKSKKTTDSAKEKPMVDPDEFARRLDQLLSDTPAEALMGMLAMKPDLARDVLESADPMGTLKSEGAGNFADINKVMELMKDFSIEEAMAGLASTGKNRKEMDNYRFWKTQPVPKFDEKEKSSEDGPVEEVSIDQIAKEPEKLRMSAYEWVTMDLTDDAEIKEVYELLNGHYVEDDEAMFRFNYGPGILKWAMMAPGWQKRYHVGVRVVQSRKLVAFISAVPVTVRVRDKVFRSSEVNFLCIHKKLRGLRLAPALIREITRVSNLDGIWQGLFTAGIVLPKPISTCRYFHRPLDWQKLYECNFVHLPANSKAHYQIRKYSLPERTATKGLREMRTGDMDAVVSLMHRYLGRFDIAPMMTREEAEHWFIPPKAGDKDQFIWSYVVEDPGTKQITDFFSFYCIESSAINNPRHSVIRVAYLFYYATEIGLMKQVDKMLLQARLNSLINDALIVAKGAKFDVFNALSLMDNALFLENQKFGAGDGQLHYYLFNYKAKPIAGGVDKLNKLDEANLSGVGFVLP